MFFVTLLIACLFAEAEIHLEFKRLRC